MRTIHAGAFSACQGSSPEENLDRFLKLVDDKHNGIIASTGSLGCSQERRGKDGRKVRRHGRIHFAHIRNVAVLDNGFERGTSVLLRFPGYVRHREGPGGQWI